MNAELPDKELRAKAFQAAESFLEWSRGISLTIQDEEVEVFSPTLNVTGHIDALAKQKKGRRKVLTILDWKTAAKLYSDNIIQLAAYKYIYEEAHPRQTIVGAHLLRFSKETSDFHHVFFEDLQEPWEQFVRLREAYEVDKHLRKRI